MNAISGLTARGLLAFCLALVLASGLQASEHIKLQDGTVLDGDAIDYDEATKVVTFRLRTGREVTYPLDQLNQQSVYQVTHSKVDKGNAEGQLKLANYARDIGLYAHAARHYRQAIAADPAIQPRVDAEAVVLRRKAAEYCMDNAKKAVERNDFRDAEKWLTTLIGKLPNEPEAEQAEQILDRYYASTRAKKQEEIEEKVPALKEELKDGKRYYDGLVEKTKEGLMQSRTGSKSVSNWESAVSDGEKALKELDKVSKKYADGATQETLAGYRRMVVDQIVETQMHLASQYMTRSSYNKAASEVNHALALDPANESALSMRSRIEAASSEGFRWW